MTQNDKDLLGASGSGREKPDAKDERDRTSQTDNNLKDAIRQRGGKPR